MSAILFPKPVSIITPEIRKAITTSQVVESPNPIRATFKGIKLKIMDRNNPMSTLVDMGIALIKTDSMVKAKIINIK